MGRKAIDRTGEEKVNKFGSKIVISEYRGALDIDVYFPEYNWTFKHAQYQNFKNRNIKCPVCGKDVKVENVIDYDDYRIVAEDGRVFQYECSECGAFTQVFVNDK